MSQVPSHPASAPHGESPPEQAAALHGIMGEFDDVSAVVRAARAAREAGYRRFDVHSPFPIHGVDEAVGIRHTILPWIVLICGLIGMGSGLVLTIFTMGNWSFDIPGPPGVPPLQSYPFMISGKPYNSLPAWIPIVFELTILIAAFGAVFGMFLLNKLPMLYHPLLKSDRFRRVTNDRFFLVIDANDRYFNPHDCAEFLTHHGAISTEVIEE